MWKVHKIVVLQKASLELQLLFYKKNPALALPCWLFLTEVSVYSDFPKMGKSLENACIAFSVGFDSFFFGHWMRRKPLLWFCCVSDCLRLASNPVTSKKTKARVASEALNNLVSCLITSAVENVLLHLGLPRKFSYWCLVCLWIP